MYIKRSIESVLKSALKKFPVVTVVGPRQSGKTTLLKHVLDGVPYVNLESIRDRQFAEQDPIGFLNQFEKGVVLDEIQRVPALLSEIQVRVDDKPRAGRYVISGSENLVVSRHISQTLAGRTSILKLMPFSMSEIPSVPRLDDLLLKGFYPRVWASKVTHNELYSSYIETFVERDVRDLLAVKNLALFRKFLGLCAGRVGQLLNKDSLAGDVGISAKSIEEWLSVLEATFVLVRLQPWHRNVGKRLIKSPKLYFVDTGLVCHLLGIETAQQLRHHPLRGSLFENMVVADMFKVAHHQGEAPRMNFYRDSNDNEVDVVVPVGNQLQPIEVKSAETFDTTFLKGCASFSRVVGDEARPPIVVMGGGPAQKRTNVHVMPWGHMRDSDWWSGE